jgi:hypothetical protein
MSRTADCFLLGIKIVTHSHTKKVGEAINKLLFYHWHCDYSGIFFVGNRLKHKSINIISMVRNFPSNSGSTFLVPFVVAFSQFISIILPLKSVCLLALSIRPLHF